MKKQLIVVCIFCVMVFNITLTAQSDGGALIIKGRCQLEEAVEKWDEAPLMSARAYFERMIGKTEHDAWTLYYIALAESKLAGYHFANQAMDDAKPYVDGGIQHLEESLKIKPDNADALALLSSLLGNKIAFDPMLGMTLGPKSGRLIGEAFALEPNNPRVSFIAGQSAFYTPEMYGGGRDIALKHFVKAVADYKNDKPSDLLAPVWGKVDAYLYQGICQMDQKLNDEALASFNYVLQIHPTHAWITQALLPELKKRMAELDVE
ncbi:hypothetical protein KAR48_03865 [bacterium]|nr:hypothetical protein [bacterium]